MRPLRTRLRDWWRDVTDPIATEPTYEVGKPWVCYYYLSDTRESALLGRSRMELLCCICGERKRVKIRIPRIGQINPSGEPHPLRVAFINEHLHPGREKVRLGWALPLRNMAGVNDIAGLAAETLHVRSGIPTQVVYPGSSEPSGEDSSPS